MESVLVELTHEKAIKLLKDLEDLNVIRLIKTVSQLSALRKQIQTPMDEASIDKQLNAFCSEWQ